MHANRSLGTHEGSEPLPAAAGLTIDRLFAILRRLLSSSPAGSTRAEVAELADAHGSGPCTRKGVGVRVPSSAPTKAKPLICTRLGYTSLNNQGVGANQKNQPNQPCPANTKPISESSYHSYHDPLAQWMYEVIVLYGTSTWSMLLASFTAVVMGDFGLQGRGK